jgi:hypothetical protein
MKRARNIGTADKYPMGQEDISVVRFILTKVAAKTVRTADVRMLAPVLVNIAIVNKPGDARVWM